MFPQAIFDSDDSLINRTQPLGNYRTIKLKPYEKPYGDLKYLRRFFNESLWITTDVHLTEGESRIATMINEINDRVGKDGHLLILGDLGKLRLNNGMTRNFIETTMKSIYTENKYLILGNHDAYSVGDYVEMGFKLVTDELTVPYNDLKIRFTHMPIPVNKSTINIHGHIHGSNEYWYTTRRHHYDAYITWTERYITEHYIDIPVQQGYPAVQQLGSLFKYYDHERCN